jgi:hypothetical protein
LLEETLPIVFVPHAFRLAPIAGHAELKASFSSSAKLFRDSFLEHSGVEFPRLREARQSIRSGS